MQPSANTIVFLLLLILAGGCAVTQPALSPALTSTARDQIGHMAIREPTHPTVELFADVDGKGAAAGKTAISAGVGWLGGSFDAAAQSNDEGAALVAIFGILTTPIVAAGGALYGAAAADSKKAVSNGNEVLVRALDFAPAQLQNALKTELEESAPIAYEFVSADTSNAELKARGFDTVLDIAMASISSHPGENNILVYFESTNRMSLTNLANGQLIAQRSYKRALQPKAISNWAHNEGGELTNSLSESFTSIADEISHELFLAPAIRVKGMEPVSPNSYRISTLPGERPLFVWSALDGNRVTPPDNVEYELSIAIQGDEPQRFITRAMRYIPPENLETCKVYAWQVRAHYTSFGTPVSSEWTPEYRFKTPCKKRR